MSYGLRGKLLGAMLLRNLPSSEMLRIIEPMKGKTDSEKKEIAEKLLQELNRTMPAPSKQELLVLLEQVSGLARYESTPRLSLA